MTWVSTSRNLMRAARSPDLTADAVRRGWLPGRSRVANTVPAVVCRARSPLCAATRLLSAAEVPRAVLRELTGHRGQGAAQDDALVVCLDWLGRG